MAPHQQLLIRGALTVDFFPNRIAPIAVFTNAVFTFSSLIVVMSCEQILSTVWYTAQIDNCSICLSVRLSLCSSHADFVSKQLIMSYIVENHSFSQFSQN